MSSTPPASIGHLAIVAPERIADVVRATPVFHAALASPDFDALTILCRPDLTPLFADGPLQARVRGYADAATMKQLLGEAKPDAVLLLCDGPEAARSARELGVPVRAGEAASSRLRSLTHAVVPSFMSGRPLAIPAGHRLRDLAGLLGLQLASLEPRLDLAPEGAREVRSILEGRGLGPDVPYVVCDPGAGAGWPAERYVKLLEALHERHGWGAVVCAPTASANPVSVPGPGATWTPEDGGLGLLRSLCAGASLVVAGEGDVRWIATAFDVPRVSILGLSRSAASTQPDARGELLLTDELDCSPHVHRSRSLGHHPGSHELSLERVLEAVDVLLEPARESASVLP